MSKKDCTTYLLRDIPKDLWSSIRSKAYDKGLTIRQYLINLMEKEATSWQKKQTETEKSPKES